MTKAGQATPDRLVLAEADACGQGRADLPAALLDINWREGDVGHPLNRPSVRV